MEKQAQRRGVAVWTASAGVSALALVVAGISLAWLVGSFGISTAAASQIVQAVEIGGAAIAIISALLSAGVVGIVVSTVMYYLRRKLRKLAIA